MDLDQVLQPLIVKQILLEEIPSSLDKGLNVISLFLDLSKAFDTANHQILLNTLKYYRLQQSEYNWFQSYLSNRKQQCMQMTLLLIHVLSPLVCLMDRY